jgi:hypothetical protein
MMLAIILIAAGFATIAGLAAIIGVACWWRVALDPEPRTSYDHGIPK